MKKDIDNFIAYLSGVLRSSPLTAKAYGIRLSAFSGWCGDKELKLITEKDLMDYTQYLANKYQSITQRHYLVALKSFLKYQNKHCQEIIGSEAVVLPKMADKYISFLDPQEIGRLFNSCDTDRDRAVISLLYDTGLRVSEMTNIRTEKIDFADKKITIIGKRGKARLVFFTDRTKDLLLRIASSPFLFGGQNPTTPRTIQKIIKKAAAKIGVPFKQITPHTLRHSFATNLMNTGLDIRAVQEMLGHTSILTTQRYTHFTDGQLQHLYQQHHQNS